MCSFFNIFFTVTGNNNTMYSKNRIDNREFHSKLPIIVFQINSISLFESEEFRETSNIFDAKKEPIPAFVRIDFVETGFQHTDQIFREPVGVEIDF